VNTSKLVQEVQQWNSPTVGAYLLWKFTSGYCNAHVHGDAPIALMHFLAIPLLTNRRLLEPINNHRANLQSYIQSFETSKDSDILTSVHDRVKRNREYTMAAIDIAVSTGLIFWDTESGKLYPHNDKELQQKCNTLKTTFIKDGKKAEILGRWFAEHSISTIATYLEVVL
jgi:Family of unknown function (DUF6521)